MSDTHWTADKIYLIGQSFGVEQHTLTIDAGTTICLFQDGAIRVGDVDPGEIHINGSAGAHVTITAVPDSGDATKPAVFHGGLGLNQWMASTVSYLDIWYGGPGGGSAAWAFSLPVTSGGTDAVKPFTVDHLTVGKLQTRGIEIGTPSGVDGASRIHIVDYVPVDADTPPLAEVVNAEIRALSSITADVIAIDVANIPAGSSFVSIQTNVTPGSVDRPTAVNDFGLPFVYTGNLGIFDDSGVNKPVWTINEGVTLRLDGVITLGDLAGNAPGDFVVAGSAVKPVTLTSNAATPAPGDWGGLLFTSGLFDPAVSKIDNAQILYAGATGFGPTVGRCGTQSVGVIAVDGTGSFVGPTITNSTIAHSPSNGIVTAADDQGSLCTTDYSTASVTFTDIAMQSLVSGGCN